MFILNLALSAESISEKKEKKLLNEGEISVINNISSIPSNEFGHFKYLQNIKLGDNIETIGDSAFEECYNLQQFIAPKKLKSINTAVFKQCYSLSSLNLNVGLSSIGCNAFESCEKLSSINIPLTVKQIEKSCFKECYALTSLNIPSSVTYIGDEAFNYCIHLKTICFEDVNSINFGHNVFLNCISLTSISFPNGYICNNQSFYNNINIALTEIPDTKDVSIARLNTIPDEKFRFSSITDINIPSCITKIGNNAFEQSLVLSSVIFNDGLKEIGNDAFRFCKSLTDIKLPNSTDNLGTGIFDKCCNLTSISLPINIQSIPAKTFYHCRSMTYLDLSQYSYLTSIENFAFQKCECLKQIILPPNLIYIGKYAFADCKKLETPSFPSSLISVDVTSFDYNILSILQSQISSVNSHICYFSSDNNSNDINEKNQLTLNQIFNYQYLEDQSLTYFEIPDGISSIGIGAFKRCKNLEFIKLPKSLKKIDMDAFRDCTKLSSVIFLSPSIDYIGDYAFQGCYSLRISSIPDEIRKKKKIYSFAGCIV